MNNKFLFKVFGFISLAFALFVVLSFCFNSQKIDILSYEVDLSEQDIRFYCSADGSNIKNAQDLKQLLSKRGEKLVFAMNGGMYLKDRTPQGLYIENGVVKKKIDTIKQAFGNFYMQPNGVFGISKSNKPVIVESSLVNELDSIRYATQSGPMLLINGAFHPRFKNGSKNLNIRNGVGILPNGNVIFAMSKQKINFYDFAMFFKNKGCENALYLDGYVSRTYLPSENWMQLDGDFGVIIAEIE